MLSKRYGFTNTIGRGFQSTAKESDFSITERIFQGGVPSEMLGFKQHGDSIFSNIAHRVETTKRFDNLVNNGIDQEIYFTVSDKGKNPITTPFLFNNKQYFPNKDGQVRIANMANVELARKIREHQEDKIDKLMSYLILGDDISAYILGMPVGEWKHICSSGNSPAGTKYDPDLLKIDCQIETIESYVDGSLLQTQALSKLRKIAKFYLNNVNLEDFDTVKERVDDMAQGVNNPFVCTDSELSGAALKQVQNMIPAAAPAAAPAAKAAKA